MGEIYILTGRFMERRLMCTHMGVVIVSKLCHRRRDKDSCACTHMQLSVSAVTACMHVRPKLACTNEILLITFILSSMENKVNSRYTTAIHWRQLSTTSTNSKTKMREKQAGYTYDNACYIKNMPYPFLHPRCMLFCLTFLSFFFP